MSDEKYMQRCLDLATLGQRHVSPNPMVACVIVHQNQIIGEGYHQKFGQAHAEVNAINSVIQQYGEATAAKLLQEATVYVNLEPCAHQGKTPPCADLLIKHRVKKVVIANSDPHERVNGKGIAKLIEAQIEVKHGVLEEQATWLNRRFFTRQVKHRPYVILKWAQTTDGFFAPQNGQQQWISCAESLALVHRWRSEEDAILVGKNTALIDRPQLSARTAGGKNPIRVLIDKNLAVPNDNPIFNNEAKTIVLNELKIDQNDLCSWVQMEDMHYYLPEKICYQLHLMDIQSLIVEGGTQTLKSFIEAGMWDEARIFYSEKTWGKGLSAPNIRGTEIDRYPIGTDQLSILINKQAK